MTLLRQLSAAGARIRCHADFARRAASSSATWWPG